ACPSVVARGELLLGVRERVGRQSVGGLDGDHEVAGVRVRGDAEALQHLEVRGRPRAELAPRDSVSLAHRARDTHQPDAVRVAIRDDAHVPGHAAAVAAPAHAVADGPSASTTILVPAEPSTASMSRSAQVTIAARPPSRTNRTADSTFGPMLPAGNSPWRRSASASDTVSRAMSRCQRVPKS